MIESLFGSIQSILIALTAIVVALILVRFIYNSASLAANPSSDGSKKRSVGFSILGLFVLIFAGAVIFLLISVFGINLQEGQSFIEQSITI